MSKPVQALTPEDFAEFAVWRYDLDAETVEGHDETWVRPVEQYPVTDLSNRIIGALVLLHNGARMPACLGNVALRNAESTREFLTLSLWSHNEWVDLARYFDVDYSGRGPVSLSRRLGLPVTEVFPITYDISEHAEGLESVLKGIIDSEPKNRLSEDERMALIFRP